MKERKISKKTWKIIGIVGGSLVLASATAFAILRGGHVDTDQMVEAIEESLQDADTELDFTEA